MSTPQELSRIADNVTEGIFGLESLHGEALEAVLGRIESKIAQRFQHDSQEVRLQFRTRVMTAVRNIRFG